MREALGEFKVSNDILNDPVKLRDRMKDEGYLFFKGLQDPSQLYSLRKDKLKVISKGGWLQPGFDRTCPMHRKHPSISHTSMTVRRIARAEFL